jgi:hypothetical protein
VRNLAYCGFDVSNECRKGPITIKMAETVECNNTHIQNTCMRDHNNDATRRWQEVADCYCELDPSLRIIDQGRSAM